MNRVALALVLLGLAVLVVPNPVVEQVAAENPTASNVYAGDSFASASSGVGTRSFMFRIVNDETAVQHRAAWEVAPGAGIAVYYRNICTDTCYSLPNGEANDYCRIQTYWDNTATVQRSIHSATSCPASEGLLTTLYCTDTGLSGGTPVAGTIRLRIEARDTVAGVPTYTADTDSASRGAIRCGLDVSSITVNAYPAAPTFAYTIAGETVTCTVAHTTAQANQVRTASVTVLDASNAAILTNALAIASGATSTASSFTVSDTFPAASTSAGCQVGSFGNSVLTGVKWTHIATATAPVTEPDDGTARRASFFNVDPRITATHLLQVDDAAFGTPPMSKDTGGSRYNDEVGYIATRFTNARGEGLSGGTFAFSRTLQDDGAVLAPRTLTGAGIGTQGGEAGWSNLVEWNDGAPTGTWTKTVDVTAPSTIDSNAHLLQATQTITLDPAGGSGGEGDPLRITGGDADIGHPVRLGLSNSFTDGTARLGNAAGIYIDIWDPTGTQVVTAANPTEVGYGVYLYTGFTPAATGDFIVRARTTDPTSGDPVGTVARLTVDLGLEDALTELGAHFDERIDDILLGNVTVLLDEQAHARIEANLNGTNLSLGDHRDHSLDDDPMSHNFNGFGFDGALGFLFWLGVLWFAAWRMSISGPRYSFMFIFALMGLFGQFLESLELILGGLAGLGFGIFWVALRNKFGVETAGKNNPAS